uniref:DSBA-like thioredoxin domain-containing protein n=1 Tax=Gossypium raimondii TaxID=29730 RepID=A0A0D2PU77_GOSRA|nr:hypothetical protein B456_001G207200 [Gossypium raimondii]
MSVQTAFAHGALWEKGTWTKQLLKLRINLILRSLNTYTDFGACVMHIILTYSCSLQIKWHPFFLDPSAPKEGVSKREYYEKKFGSRTQGILARMTEIFRNVGLEYDMSGLTGNTLDSHRLIYFAGKQGLDKQHALVEELYLGYFTQGKYIGDREFLLESARKVGVEGAAEFLENPNNGVKEVNEDLEKYSANISGVPNYVINGKQQLSGGQPPEVFLRAFQVAAK